MKILLSVLCVVFVSIGHAQKRNNLAASPPMGWNSWNYFGKKAVDEKLIKEVIDAMAAHKLNKYGYEYVVVDGGWRDTKLGSNGELLVNDKFPSGMNALADYAHERGFKFGLHTVPGSHDCNLDNVGAWGHEEVHVNQLVSWGVDLIKLDKCRFSLDEDPDYPRKDKRWNAGWAKDKQNLVNAYAKWNKLLRESGRQVLLSASAYRYYDWYPKYTHMGRTTGDIQSLWSGGAVFDGKTRHKGSVMSIAERNNKYYQHAGPGYWNDPDMMVTGDQGLTIEEQKAHFALWCIMSSPLILGNDPRNMNAEELEIITNEQAIAINQDPTAQGRRIKQDGKNEIWAKKLSDGSYAVLLINRDTQTSSDITVNWKDLNLKGKQVIRDVYNERKPGVYQNSFTKSVAPHASLFFTIKAK